MNSPITRSEGITLNGTPVVTHENRFMRVTESPVTFPNGAEGKYSVVTSGSGIGVVVVPTIRFRGISYVGLVSQYRWPIKKQTLEFPRGGTESEESAIDSAYREMTEETGIPDESVSSMNKAGFIHPDTGLLDTIVYIYIAHIDASELDRKHVEGETGAELKWMTVPSFHGLVQASKVNCSITLSALMMAQLSHPNLYLNSI